MKRRTFFARLALIIALSAGVTKAVYAQTEVSNETSERKFWGSEPTSGVPLCLGGVEYMSKQDYVFWLPWGNSYLEPTGNHCP